MIVKWSFKFVLCVLTFLPALSGHVFTPPRDGRTVLLEKPAAGTALPRTESGHFVAHPHQVMPVTGELLRASAGNSSALHHD